MNYLLYSPPNCQNYWPILIKTTYNSLYIVTGEEFFTRSAEVWLNLKCWSRCYFSLLRWDGFPLLMWRRRTDFACWNVYSAPIQAETLQWTPCCSATGPTVISLFDKNPETWTQEEVAVPLKTFSCPLTDSHTEMSNNRFQERHVISYLYAVLSAPAAHWEVHVLCLDNPPPSRPLPLNFSYYWWLHHLVWVLPFVVVMYRGQQGSII